jgi:hypothetical protein
MKRTDAQSYNEWQRRRVRDLSEVVKCPAMIFHKAAMSKPGALKENVVQQFSFDEDGRKLGYLRLLPRRRRSRPIL